MPISIHDAHAVVEADKIVEKTRIALEWVERIHHRDDSLLFSKLDTGPNLLSSILDGLGCTEFDLRKQLSHHVEGLLIRELEVRKQRLAKLTGEPE